MTSDSGDRDDARRRRRVRGFVRAIAVASPFLVLGGVEVALRLADFPPDAPPGTRALDLTDPRLFRPDPELLWAFRPDASLDVGEPAFPPFRTNSLGLRGAAFPAAREPGEVRVACVGDSITFGLGLRDEATLPSRLEARLRAHPALAGRPVRVLNAGVPGYGSVQGLRLLRRIAHLRPDVVVWCFGMNDARPALGVPDAHLRVTGDGTGGLPGAVAALRLVRLGAWIRTRGGTSTRVPPDDFRETLRGAADAAAECGAALVVVETPQRLDVKLAQFDAVLSAAHAAGAVEVRGSFPLLSAYAPSPVTADAVHRVERGEGGAVRVVFGTDDAWANRVATVAEVEARREQVRAWRENVAALAALLPADALRAADLLGTTTSPEAYSDNCHLTERGADAAAAVLADRIAGLLAGRR